MVHSVGRCTKTENGLRCMLAVGHEPYNKCVFKEGVDA